MRLWKTILIGVVGAFVIAGGASLVAMAAGDPPAPGVLDVKGNCDEAEHRDEPRCQGPQVPEDADRDDDGDGLDLSGNCDEAEHANDPECRGGQPRHGDRGDDRSGPNSGPSGNSGPSENAGPGGDDDSSGPGSGDDDDDDDDDSSGPGSGNGDSDNSGPGGGDDD